MTGALRSEGATSRLRSSWGGSGRLRAALAGRRFRETAWVLGVLLVGALAHAVDMFNYPFYQQDEGTYVSQAWSVFHLGHLAPYTYWYDHPPAGWIQLGGLMQLFGQAFNVPSDIEAGRIVMLGFQIGAMALLYVLARGLGRSVAAATVAVLVFALSPYGLVFHRRILLDNIAAFWLIASLVPLASRRLTLSRVWMSALMLGIGVLSKEILVVTVPALALLVAVRADRSQRSLATLGWLTLVLSVSSLWLLFALLKGELLPPGTTAAAGHVSLIETLVTQAARGRDGGLLQAGSHFWAAAAGWIARDPLLVVGGTGVSVSAALSLRRHPAMGALGIAVLSLWAFLGRGGVTLDFYLVPLLPLLALEIGWAFDLARELARGLVESLPIRGAVDHPAARRTAAALLSVSVVLTGSGSLVRASERDALWSSPQAATQRAAISWIRSTLPTDSTIVIDMFAWPDLHEPTVQAPTFPRAEYYWKAEEDPAIRHGMLANDWRRVDYVMATPDLIGDASQLPFVQTILDHADVVRRIDQGGWPVLIERTRTLRSLAAPSDPLLGTLWADWTSAAMPAGNGGPAAASASPAQVAMAMAAAVYMNDRVAFEALWSAAKARLLGSDGLFRPGDGGLRDPGADTDAAVALLFAANQWGDPSAEADAQAIIRSIWSRETAVVGGTRLVVASATPTGATAALPVVVDDSALAPYAYRLFAQADPQHAWDGVLDSTYAWLARLRLNPALGGPVGVVPHRVVIDATGAVSPVGGTLGGSHFDAAASELPWRLGLDLLWNGEPRARDVLEWLSVPRRAVEATGSVLASYNLDGMATGPQQDLMTSSTVLPSLLATGRVELAASAFASNVLSPALAAGPGALDARSLGWAWFAAALMDGGLVNLTGGEATIDWSRSGLAATPAHPPAVTTSAGVPLTASPAP